MNDTAVFPFDSCLEDGDDWLERWEITREKAHYHLLKITLRAAGFRHSRVVIGFSRKFWTPGGIT
jgi:hypothetical protein